MWSSLGPNLVPVGDAEHAREVSLSEGLLAQDFHDMLWEEPINRAIYYVLSDHFDAISTDTSLTAVFSRGALILYDQSPIPCVSSSLNFPRTTPSPPSFLNLSPV